MVSAVLLWGAGSVCLYENRCLYVPALVNGREMLMLVDTGANRSAIDAAFAKEAGLRTRPGGRVEGTAGSISVNEVLVPSLSVGRTQLASIRCTVQDLSGLLRPQGRSVQGILGTDFLRRFVTRINFRKPSISFSTAVGKAGGVPVEWGNGIPQIEARLEGIACKLRIDTGASLFETSDVYINAPVSVYERLTRVNPWLRFEKYFSATGTGGQMRLGVARMRAATVGGKKISKPWLIVQPLRGYFARPDAVGFVGNNFLEKFGPVTLDGPRSRLILSSRLAVGGFESLKVPQGSSAFSFGVR